MAVFLVPASQSYMLPEMSSATQVLVVLFLLSSSLFLQPCPISAAQKVSLALYYEALCPFCSRFIVNSLSKIFTDGLISIVDLRLVPFGNAQIGPNYSISCQHGPNECFLDTVEACAINAWSDVQQHFSFILCVEQLVLENKFNEWQSCFQKTGLDSHPLVDCYNSGRGQQIELQFAAETGSLQPPHRFVPWVTVNGMPINEDYESFQSYVCKAYQGNLPMACTGLPLKIPRRTNSNGVNTVCVL